MKLRRDILNALLWTGGGVGLVGGIAATYSSHLWLAVLLMGVGAVCLIFAD